MLSESMNEGQAMICCMQSGGYPTACDCQAGTGHVAGVVAWVWHATTATEVNRGPIPTVEHLFRESPAAMMSHYGSDTQAGVPVTTNYQAHTADP